MQVGLHAGADASPQVPLELAIAHELELVGSHGLQAWHFPDLLDMVSSGRLNLSKLIDRTISLDDAPAALEAMGSFGSYGMTVIDDFASPAGQSTAA